MCSVCVFWTGIKFVVNKMSTRKIVYIAEKRKNLSAKGVRKFEEIA